MGSTNSVVVPGSIRCKIAKPREFYPFSRTKVEIHAAETIDDITLLRVTPGEFVALPRDRRAAIGIGMVAEPARHGEEKKTLTVYCNFCHEYQQIFRRNRYDESGWANVSSFA